MDRLTPRIRDYAWGSRTALAELTGRPGPTDAPEAELWMGAHEGDPSGLSRGREETTLDRIIEADPDGEIGENTAVQFNRRLPFLLKVLAPEHALSIQVHPSSDDLLTAFHGTYADRWPKPEAWLAVTPFEVFAGSRPYAEVVALADLLGAQGFSALVQAARSQSRPMHALLSALLRLDADRAGELVAQVCEAAARHTGDETVAAMLRVAEDFPGDIGLIVLLTMRYRVMQPGDYLFVPAGVMHAGVRGVVVEIQASSDSIVRAGLTSKRIDVAELLRIVDTDRSMVPERGSRDGRVVSFPVDVPYFQLHQVLPGAEPVVVPGAHRPRIVLALHGEVVLDDGADQLRLASGDSAFVPASQERVTCSGDGTAYVATTGLAH
ncbi:mannose-6-phosphate isomerase, class I [Calidifontibacter sp. DB0510]|uniref:mannose-6-phosphate isomerase n=1 Tax=Metallococcus carri TaxID=1656884 RepID=A0A967AYR0_9MICO|nr:mannose-6-phosphate isomerase, class I [Metallococcus carri]NHN55514.1 mannose-6-phosphate isomerase, class I [Metallococcus carri]NOP38302.1 mannose-6-phosphate isomerase, class I [Calidifontibacter sp. DB2511S]